MGRVLGDRYRLSRPLGTGASAHVYVAEDVVLRRRVAVKVLHPGLAGDEAFLRRFRAEARVVAALRHPHILRIYDWGEEDESPYLVTELLEGGSLRSLLDQGSLLTAAQAAQVGAQAASALDHAHRRGLVHRDIKPANLLFDDEGRVSVADFGLARALAEATWTEPAGAIVGTARYAAPEQVQGRILDDRADVYALALVLAEATTGVVPFATDTTLGTLMARIGRELELPASLGALGRALTSAAAPEPAERPDSARFAADLRRVGEALPAPAPLPLASPLLDGRLEVDPDPTSIARRSAGGPAGRATRRAGPGSVLMDPVAGPAEGATAGDGPRPLGSAALGSAAIGGNVIDGNVIDGNVIGVGALDVAVAAVGTASSLVPAGLAPTAAAPAGPAIPSATDGRPKAPPVDWEQWEQREQPQLPRSTESGSGAPSHRRRLLAFTAAGVLLAAAGGGGAAWALTRTPPPVPVPSLRGETASQAGAALRARHLRLVVVGSSYDGAVRRGAVVSQVPLTGKVRRGATVAVTLSSGPAPVPVPTVDHLALADARRVISAAHLRVGQVTRQTSIDVPAGSVISSRPATGDALPGSRVELVVSKGKPLVTVPLLRAGAVESYTAAAAALQAAHLQPSEQLVYSDLVSPGLVVITSPPPGRSVVYGSPITVEVSKGPHLVTIPTSIVGESVSVATSQLEALGLGVSGVTGNPAANVTGTTPGVGQAVRFGSYVQLVTG